MKLRTRHLLPTLACLALGVCAALSSTSVAQTTATDKVANLTGTFDGFKVKKTATGMLKLRGNITLANSGAFAAKNVRVNFYLSTDTELDPEDLVHTVTLAEYNEGKSKLKPGKQIVIPLKQKFVAFIGSLLEGQYLLVQFVADNNAPEAASKVVAIGPISVPQ